MCSDKVEISKLGLGTTETNIMYVNYTLSKNKLIKNRSVWL